jgi:hypothetical protein
MRSVSKFVKIYRVSTLVEDNQKNQVFSPIELELHREFIIINKQTDSKLCIKKHDKEGI